MYRRARKKRQTQTDESKDERKAEAEWKNRTAAVNVKTVTQFTVRQQGSLAASKAGIYRCGFSRATLYFTGEMFQS